MTVLSGGKIVSIVLVASLGVRGGGGWILSTILKWGDFAQGSNPLTLFDIFHEISAPFVYLLLTNGTPFTYLVWNFAALLTAVNALLLK